ncbi:MAG: magnesium-translocating P-type ATPase [Candidatus Aenigmatarchaeota archaeon]
MHWYKSSEEVIKELGSSSEGLTEKEAKRRLSIYGLNDIPKRMEKSAISIYFSQLKDPLLLLLFIAAIIAYITESVTESIIILAILFINSLLGFVQEYKSEKALRKLCKLIKYYTKVLRDGNLVEIDTRYLVPGDIVLLETGDRVPADLRLIEVDELEIDESLITGESFPVQKVAEPILKEKLQPSEMKNIAFMGTLVTNGKGKGIVISTGMKSTFGEIAGYLKAEEPITHYQKSIKKLSELLMLIVITGLIFIFFINSILGKKVLDSLLFSLALAVGIVPEALPIIITISLSNSSMKMASKGAITKKLVAIENFGNVDVLCIDKTGTLTQNKIKLVDYLDLNEERNIEIILLASTALSIVRKRDKFKGNSIDVAIAEFAKSFPKRYEVLDLIPFDYERKRISSIIKKDGEIFLICKGAPESIISICSFMKKNGKIVELDKKFVNEILEDLFKKGYRVIAISEKPIEKKEKYSINDESNLILLGFLCFTDPPKHEVKEVVNMLKKLGIEIKILTGDNALIAEHVMREVDIEIKGVLSGAEIQSMNETELQKAVEESNLFVRLTPNQKVKIIEALRKNGHVVGFLGDGANDAPALRKADVGISVENGVDIAKEASDIILTKKSLNVILDGIIEGRRCFGNTTKYLLNTLSANMGNMTTLAIISPILNFLPMLPSQILLTNLITDGPLLSISTDRIDEEELKKPRHWNINFIKKFCILFGLLSSFFDLATMAMLLILKVSVEIFRTAWFLLSVLSEIFLIFVIRTRKEFFKTKPSEILILSSLIFGLLTILIVFSPLGSYFEFVPLNGNLIILISFILIAYFCIAEVLKYFFFKKFGS